MNAHLTTARDLASAMLGKRRVAQDVRVVTSTYFGGDEPRRIVLVTPFGAEQGEYYEVMTRRALDALREGRFTPDELDLTVAEGIS